VGKFRAQKVKVRMTIRKSLLSGLPAILVALTASRATATVVLPQNIEQLESQAQWVFVGVCTSRTATIDERGIPVRVFTFQVIEPVKGDLKAGNAVRFRQFGSGVPNRQGLAMFIAGIPTYRLGQKVVLFLNGASRLGLTGPVGLSQGVFDVERDAQGRETIRLDPLRRRELVAKVDREKYAAVMRLTADEDALLSNPPERVDLATLCSVVRKIAQERERREKGQ
jgi:hypothetical protein